MSSRTSQKHRNFLSEPMGEKSVTKLAGIGDTLGQRLSSRGYSKASDVLGQYLVMRKDREQFTNWVKGTTGANDKQSSDCHKCISDWANEYV